MSQLKDVQKNISPFSYTPILKHALATPITNVLANLEIAQNQHSHSSSHHIYLQQALINARYLKNVLSLADKPIDFGRFEINIAINEIIYLNNRINQKHLTINNSLPKKFYIDGNKLPFQEMLVILLNNAFEAYPKNAITKPVFLTARATQSQLIITLLDGGKGMNWLEKQRCFNKYFTTKTKHGGGLGLFFVKNTLEKDFSGKIKLESKLGRGTKIKITIPRKNSNYLTH